ncbi:hypothetical protein [Dactylosporangium sp. CA-139066]|uniref:hypothetical protein n=1 Tax=Dactylosporangium sp. CA-139066 TaxID=3239930 RepID=UPI003D930CA9
MTYDIYGMRHPDVDRLVAEQIRDMMFPVRCTCGQVYDLGKVEVTARYTDCSMWKAPCCGRQADDRGETGWKSTQDYYRLDRDGRVVRR